MTALSIASYFGSTDACKMLCASKANPNHVAANGTTPLILAVSQNRVAVVESLIQAFGEDLDQSITIKKNVTALYLACQDGRGRIVEQLLQHSLSALETKKDGGATPLYIAAHEGHLDCVAHLIAAKAHIDNANESGATPLYIAVQRNHNEVTDILLNAMADPNAQTNTASPPLLVAVFHCNLTCVRQLLAAGAEIDAAQSTDGNSAAMLAAFSLDVDILCELLLFGASLNGRNNAGASVDDILRTRHGVSVRQLAFYCLAHYGSDELGSWGGEGEADAKIRIQKLFDTIDADGDGTVTKQELNAALTSWGLSSKFVEQPPWVAVLAPPLAPNVHVHFDVCCVVGIPTRLARSWTLNFSAWTRMAMTMYQSQSSGPALLGFISSTAVTTRMRWLLKSA